MNNLFFFSKPAKMAQFAVFIPFIFISTTQLLHTLCITLTILKMKSKTPIRQFKNDYTIGILKVHGIAEDSTQVASVHLQ